MNPTRSCTSKTVPFEFIPINLLEVKGKVGLTGKYDATKACRDHHTPARRKDVFNLLDRRVRGLLNPSGHCGVEE
jgi:hypothetical protein